MLPKILVAQRVKRLPALRETRIWSWDWEDPLEKEMATHSGTLAWKIPWKEKPVGYSLPGRKEADTTEWLQFWIFQFVVIYTVKGFGTISKAEVDFFFLELSCFLYDSTDIGNLISGSSAFSKTSLNVWKFIVHILLKPGLENFEHYSASLWDECNCAVVWTLFGTALLWAYKEICPKLSIKKAECQRIDAFELWCWRRLLRVPWTAKRSNQSILKGSVLNIHWKVRCWS